MTDAILLKISLLKISRVLSPSIPDVLALRETQTSRAALRPEERDASWRVRGGRVQKKSHATPPASPFVGREWLDTVWLAKYPAGGWCRRLNSYSSSGRSALVTAIVRVIARH